MAPPRDEEGELFAAFQGPPMREVEKDVAKNASSKLSILQNPPAHPLAQMIGSPMAGTRHKRERNQMLVLSCYERGSTGQARLPPDPPRRMDNRESLTSGGTGTRADLYSSKEFNNEVCLC